MTKPIDRDRLKAILMKYGADGQRGPVLVVEDDDDARSVLRRALEREGWGVVEAQNGRVALERLDRALPGLVLLDLMMPEMDGFEFLEAFRQREGCEVIPVVVITGKELSDDERGRLNGGVERIVQKGAYGRDELLAQVRELVADHAAQRRTG
jgi:CheY-like chemotaxis protein